MTPEDDGGTWETSPAAPSSQHVGGRLERRCRVASAVFGSQLGLKSKRARREALRCTLLHHLPATLHAREVAAAALKRLDKPFACAWLDEQRVAVGTKCNTLLTVDTCSMAAVEVPLLQPPGRSGSSGEAGGCGIHCMALSPAGNMLATGGASAADCTILDVASMRPVQTLVGHLDWLFGVAWVTERHLVTGSRDRSVKLWHVSEGGPAVNDTPLHTTLQHKRKVRDVKYCPLIGRLGTLGLDGCLMLWDAQLKHVRTATLQYSAELMCLAMDANSLAVGSQSHVTLLDARQRGAVHHIASAKPNSGVRSVAFLEHLLSVGTGNGVVSVWDRRASRYLEAPAANITAAAAASPATAQTPPPAPQPFEHVASLKPLALELEGGFLERNDTFTEYFSDIHVGNAVYAHAWDPAGQRMFACGGPLAYGLRGAYMACWD